MRWKRLENLPVPLEEPAAEICAWNKVCWAKRGMRACTSQSRVKELIYAGVKYLNVARERALLVTIFLCYVTAGTFARRGLSSTAKTLRSLVRWFEVLSTKSKKRT